MAKKPRRLSIVKVKRKYAGQMTSKEYPFIGDMPLIFLGEIPNMPDHGVFVGHKSGRIYSGYHIDQFTELSEKEV